MPKQGSQRFSHPSEMAISPARRSPGFRPERCRERGTRSSRDASCRSRWASRPRPRSRRSSGRRERSGRRSGILAETSGWCGLEAAHHDRGAPGAAGRRRSGDDETGHDDRGDGEPGPREPHRPREPEARLRKPRFRRSGRAARRGPAPGPWSSRTAPRGPSRDIARRSRRGSSASSAPPGRAARARLDDRGQRLRGSRPIERAPARRHLVEDRSERELVRSEVHGLAARLLRRHVADGPQDRPGFRAARQRRQSRSRASRRSPPAAAWRDRSRGS